MTVGTGPARQPRRTGDAVGDVLAAVDRISMWGAWASAACIVAILGLIVAEVSARNFLGASLYFAWEFSAYLMGAAFMLGAGYALRAGTQIRVNVLLENVPAPVARFFDLLSTVACVVIAAFLAWSFAEATWLSWVRDSRSPEKSELPLWIPKIALAVGAAVFLLQTAARLARLLRGEPGDDPALRIGQDIE
ncbi:MAG: TRAP transporter small permease [Rhodospirillales bacterium]|nr:MAG: TRAP transporter small permease [Rhodospirillales bacterium]